MAAELDNMKRLSKVRVDVIEVDPTKFVFRVQYSILADDDSVLYRHGVSQDLSQVGGVSEYTIAQMNTWATGKARADARARYGRD